MRRSREANINRELNSRRTPKNAVSMREPMLLNAAHPASRPRRQQRDARAAATAARLREDVLEPVGHAQWVFTVPKMLRPYFLRHRELLGDLCRAAWDTVREMMVAAAGQRIRPGMVAVVQTFGSKINPHVHAIVSRGGWTEAGQWVPVASVDPHAAALLFRHKVLSLLRHKELIDQDRIALLLSWKHSGFSVHNSVVVQPQDSRAIERLVRYVMRSPVSLDRLGFDHQTGEVRLEPNPGADDGAEGEQVERLEGDELVARVIVQIPDPKRHLIRSYGRYANAARAKRKRQAAVGGFPSGAGGMAGSALPSSEPVVSEPDSAERKAARKRWANLIRHIYEVDPLVCPRCGGAMKVISRSPTLSGLGASAAATHARTSIEPGVRCRNESRVR